MREKKGKKAHLSSLEGWKFIVQIHVGWVSSFVSFSTQPIDFGGSRSCGSKERALESNLRQPRLSDFLFDQYDVCDGADGADHIISGGVPPSFLQPLAS